MDEPPPPGEPPSPGELPPPGEPPPPCASAGAETDVEVGVDAAGIEPSDGASVVTESPDDGFGWDVVVDASVEVSAEVEFVASVEVGPEVEVDAASGITRGGCSSPDGGASSTCRSSVSS
ncbi:MAG: hypothetical protein AAF547_01095 [Actinomycetota bacterium]